ncbi:MAG: ATP-binding protein [Actinomycetota bacterium]|nr:ATP-binding protein [Coriobacteriia bacterium]MDP2233291.1 ATP-binding protein [Actinomycetota bacterium]
MASNSGASELGRIFDAFNQVEHPEGASTKGTGLGLAITRDLAQLLGGDVSVTSVEGEGSVFTICLPSLSGER